MSKLLVRSKSHIDAYLVEFLGEHKQKFAQVNDWGTDLLDRLIVFVTRGKTVRGSLVLTTAQIFGRPLDPAAVKIAAAIELVHAGLLIHDDIIDRDAWRRAGPSVYAQYAHLARQKGISQSTHFGISMGICAADVCFFLGLKIIGTLNPAHVPLHQVNDLIASEFAAVCIAQMQDVSLGFLPTTASEADIQRLYRFKTARYTFSLPLVIGAILAGQNPKTRQKLEQLGEHLGTLYQLRDDLFAIEATAAQIGKTVGGDVREKKQTLLYLWLRQHTAGRQRLQLEKIFSTAKPTAKDMGYVASLTKSAPVNRKLVRVVDHHTQAAKEIIARLPIDPQAQQQFIRLITFVTPRHK